MIRKFIPLLLNNFAVLKCAFSIIILFIKFCMSLSKLASLYLGQLWMYKVNVHFPLKISSTYFIFIIIKVTLKLNLKKAVQYLSHAHYFVPIIKYLNQFHHRQQKVYCFQKCCEQLLNTTLWYIDYVLYVNNHRSIWYFSFFFAISVALVVQIFGIKY